MNKAHYEEIGEDIAELSRKFAGKMRKTGIQHASAYAFGRVVEQFATALIWKMIHPEVQPPSTSENRSEQ